jgi:hypothetical protein
MFTQHLTVHGQYLGSIHRGLTRVHSDMLRPVSYAYFCPDCGEVWAQAAMETKPNGGKGKWCVWTVPCRYHPGLSPFSVAGSLLLSWEHDYNEALLTSLEAARWEMDRHLELFDRKIA